MEKAEPMKEFSEIPESVGKKPSLFARVVTWLKEANENSKKAHPRLRKVVFVSAFVAGFWTGYGLTATSLHSSDRSAAHALIDPTGAGTLTVSYATAFDLEVNRGFFTTATWVPNDGRPEEYKKAIAFYDSWITVWDSVPDDY